MQEKQLGRDFELSSGYSLYHAVKEVKASGKRFVSADKA